MLAHRTLQGGSAPVVPVVEYDDPTWALMPTHTAADTSRAPTTTPRVAFVVPPSASPASGANTTAANQRGSHPPVYGPGNRGGRGGGSGGARGRGGRDNAYGR